MSTTKLDGTELVTGAGMFRIRKTFENKQTSIYKVEGKVTDDNLESWLEGILALDHDHDRHLILDFCQAWFISKKALDALFRTVRKEFYVLNCPMEMRNALHAAGQASRMLE